MYAADWWRLPGPHRFVADLVDRLDDGVSMVIVTPDSAAPLIADVLSDRIDEELPFMTLVRARPRVGREGPRQLLEDALAVGSGASLEDSIGKGHAAGRAVLADDTVMNGQWPDWLSVLRRIGPAVHACAAPDRPRICLIAARSTVEQLPAQWSNTIHRLQHLLSCTAGQDSTIPARQTEVFRGELLRQAQWSSSRWRRAQQIRGVTPRAAHWPRR